MDAGSFHSRRAALAAGLALAACASLGAAAASPSTAKTTIAVTVGAPTEVSVKLSKSSNLPAGEVVFAVTNSGHVSHTFKVCTKPETTLANSCAGKAVKLAKHGAAAKLSMTLKTGKYEFLSTAVGQSVAGRKGTIGVGVKVSAATQAIPAATSAGGGTGKTGGSTGGSSGGSTGGTTGSGGSTLPTFPAGNAKNGAGVFQSADCGSCHTLAAAGSTGGGGPDLDDLKPSVGDVELQVYNGGGGMPPFGGDLTNQQIADVAAYVAASTQ